MKELKNVLSELNIYQTRKEFEELFGHLDSDGNGKVEKHEFIRGLIRNNNEKD